MSSAYGPQRPPILLTPPASGGRLSERSRRERVVLAEAVAAKRHRVVAGDVIEPEFPGITTGAGVRHPIRRHCP